MEKYSITLGRNGSSFKKVYISLPSGIYDLKGQKNGCLSLDIDTYMYAFSHGLKDLLNNGVVIVKRSSLNKTKTKTIHLVSRKSEEKQMRPPKKEDVAVESAVSEGTSEQGVEQTPEVIEEVSEQPKKKSKKKK